ncbi:MAG: hypothetical protein ACRDKT_12725 [Actinomycetota bacterium]
MDNPISSRAATLGSRPPRTRTAIRVMLGVIAMALIATACANDDEGAADTSSAAAAVAAADFTVTEETLPDDFAPAPTVEFGGKDWDFDTIPGHYWKVLDDGYAVGLHFQTKEPFEWAHDVPEGELLYVVYAIPGECPGGNFEKSVKAPGSTIQGAVPPGFDHWHGVVGAGPKFGHWLLHYPVRDFNLAGPPGNPMDGMEITAGTPQFMPICEPQ